MCLFSTSLIAVPAFRTVCFSVLLLSLSSLFLSSAFADETKAADPAEPKAVEQTTISYDVNREVKMVKPLKTSLAGKKIFIQFKESPRMSRVLQDYLASHGLTVVAEESQADMRFLLQGVFMIGGIQKKNVNFHMHEFFEKTVAVDQKEIGEAKATTITLVGVGSVVGTQGIRSVFSYGAIAEWLSEKTGISGFVNEMLTGNKNGICLHPDCDKYVTQAYLMVSGQDTDSYWVVKEYIKHQDIVIDFLADDIIRNGLQPIIDAKEPQP